MAESVKPTPVAVAVDNKKKIIKYVVIAVVVAAAAYIVWKYVL